MVLAMVTSTACSWGAYDGVYTGPDGGVGQACGGNEGANVVCDDGLTCLNGICAATCTGDDQCASGQRCLPQGTGSCGSSSCTINACVTATQEACDCAGATCATCTGAASTSCAYDGQCRATCSSGASTSGCLGGQTCITDNPNCRAGSCTAHCYGASPHDVAFDSGR
jgi:hypothetical protein